MSVMVVGEGGIEPLGVGKGLRGGEERREGCRRRRVLVSFFGFLGESDCSFLLKPLPLRTRS